MRYTGVCEVCGHTTLNCFLTRKGTKLFCICKECYEEGGGENDGKRNKKRTWKIRLAKIFK